MMGEGAQGEAMFTGAEAALVPEIYISVHRDEGLLQAVTLKAAIEAVGHGCCIGGGPSRKRAQRCQPPWPPADSNSVEAIASATVPAEGTNDPADTTTTASTAPAGPEQPVGETDAHNGNGNDNGVHDDGITGNLQGAPSLESCQLIVVLATPNYGSLDSAEGRRTHSELQNTFREDRAYYIIKTCERFASKTIEACLPDDIARFLWCLPSDLSPRPRSQVTSFSQTAPPNPQEPSTPDGLVEDIVADLQSLRKQSSKNDVRSAARKKARRASKRVREAREAQREYRLNAALARSRCTAEAKKRIREMLHPSKPTFLVNLQNQNVDDAACEALAMALEKDKYTKELRLYSNRIGTNGIVALCEGLQANRTLTMLSVGCNYVCDKGAEALGRMLEVNRSLQKLWLWRAAIGDEGALKLAVGAKENYHLESIELEGNLISDKGREKMEAELRVRAGKAISCKF